MPAPNKAYRQSLRRRARNRPVLTSSRARVLAARAALASAPKTAETGETVQAAIKKLATAARKGIIHKNNAARRISRLMKAANKAAK